MEVDDEEDEEDELKGKMKKMGRKADRMSWREKNVVEWRGEWGRRGLMGSTGGARRRAGSAGVWAEGLAESGADWRSGWQSCSGTRWKKPNTL